MIGQIAGAFVRAVLVAITVSAPSLLVADQAGGSSEVIALVALCLGVFVFIEYVSSYPSLLEFRDAPPFKPYAVRILRSDDHPDIAHLSWEF